MNRISRAFMFVLLIGAAAFSSSESEAQYCSQCIPPRIPVLPPICQSGVLIGHTTCVVQYDICYVGSECGVAFANLGDCGVNTLEHIYADENPMRLLCAAPWNNRVAEIENVSAQVVHAERVGIEDGNIEEGAPAEISREELEQIEVLRDITHRDVQNGRVPEEIAQYIKLMQSERRDNEWANYMEEQIAREVTALPLQGLGLSQPNVRCATNVCEIAIVQSLGVAQDSESNWQAIFLGARKISALGSSVVDSAMVMRVIDAEKMAFLTWVLVDRGMAKKASVKSVQTI
ncbi:hypothetical protein [Pseudoxanthomonas sangjuensis]|uniref:hypothetical protein n=1 Tax=Pseudoxanthomonas sangjuensis TaxID=1503750 RepID=UPI0013917E05|nr:hypothetical protein [Pseudoxanthomonas sangjuensis]